MEDDEDVDHFPDIGHKLAAPKKLSAFERDRQAAEAKARRAEEENAAALREFEESFGNDDVAPDRGYGNISRDAPTGPRGGGFAGRGARHGGGPPMGPRGGLTGMMPKSGPGSLGPAPGGMAPPPSLKRKRMMEEAREAEEARREQAGHDGAEQHGRPGSRASPAVEEDVPRPTVQLSSIPPGTTTEELHVLLAPHLTVHSIRFAPPAGPGTVGRKSLTAIATLDSKTTALQIDTAVSSLRDRYVGCGFYLYMSRHLSSTAQLSSSLATGKSANSEPFGAQVNREPKFSMRHAPPPGDQRGFAPPEYYESRGPTARPAAAQIEVHPPSDLATIRAIHTIVDRVKAEDDPAQQLELEALFMTLPEIQQDERFAFLYDSKSPAGVYYRFCLWGPENVDEQRRRAKGTERIFSDLDTDWLPPYNELPFPDMSSLAEATGHIDYDSSEEEEDDEGDERNDLDGQAGSQRKERTRLTPLQRARFTFMLSRLPTSIAKLRQGDISRITNFVISHAGGGAEDFVRLLLLNLERPFSATSAAKAESSASEDGDDSAYEPDDALPSMEKVKRTPPPTTGDSKRDEDPSNAKLIALYVISDILSASSTAGARNAWKYRQLFESGFKSLKTFERLGRLEKELGWGRMKAEQWKRKMGVVFGVWESWSAFQSEVLDGFKKAFYEPPLTEEERLVKEREEQEAKAKVVEPKGMSKFKKVEMGTTSASASPAPAVQAPMDDIDGVPMDDVDGVPMEEDVDGMPMEDVDGQPMGDLEAVDVTPAAAPPDQPDGAASSKSASTAVPPRGGFSLRGGKAAAPAPKKRMRAEDMFGDSDEE